MRISPIAVRLALLGLCAAAPAAASEAPPAMDKSASGTPLSADVDHAMCAPDGVALGGLDPVSYRQPDGPLPGSDSFEATHDKKTYRFATAGNLATFRDDPARYAPAYGGFCAITLALGRVTCPDFSNFQIEDDRLYLFEVTGFTNGRTLWNTDAAEYRRQADANYRRLTVSE